MGHPEDLLHSPGGEEGGEDLLHLGDQLLLIGEHIHRNDNAHDHLNDRAGHLGGDRNSLGQESGDELVD